MLIGMTRKIQNKTKLNKIKIKVSQIFENAVLHSSHNLKNMRTKTANSYVLPVGVK